MIQGRVDPATIVEQYTPDPKHERVLLINPPVFDTRFPWRQWQQPITLLQLSTLLQRSGCEVRLIDALYVPADESLRRRRVRILQRGDVSINYWRFGMLKSQIAGQLRSYAREGWYPDAVYVAVDVTFWWEGAKEAIELVRERFPRSVVILGGSYSQLAPSHAALHVHPDIVVTGLMGNLRGLPLDLSSYPSRPAFSYLAIDTSDRTSEDILNEIADKTSFVTGKGRVTQFAFADHDVAGRFPAQFRGVLEGVIEHRLKARFYAFGNIYPRTLAHDPALTHLMKQAGYRQIVFADDRDERISATSHSRWVETCRLAIENCRIAGYPVRTEAISATLSVGRLGERLEDIAGQMTQLAHVAGSLIPIPYQPSPTQCPSEMPLELQNGKLFPFAEKNGVTYREYQDLLGLAALFNAKYRSRTFDFSGDGLISQLVQASLTSGRWDPKNVPGGIPERPITVGWFNKEGKWVRS